MNGRSFFRRFGGLLNIIATCICILPRGIRVFLLKIFRNTDGNVGFLIRYLLVKKLAKSCGDNIVIKPYVVLQRIENLSLGNNVSIHHFSYIDAEGEISIGDDVSIAHSSSILSSNHVWKDASMPIKYNPVEYSRVVIEDDVWIGCGCRVLAGTHIHKHSVVAAGAVVNKNIESHTVVGGVPARVLKRI